MSAAILLVVTKYPDIYTVLAAAACAVTAGLTMTKLAYRGAVLGGLLVAASLTLQSVLAYRCLDCIRADILLLSGTIFLSIVEQGKMRKPLRVMAALMTLLLAVNVVTHSPITGLNKAGAAPADRIERYLEAAVDGSYVTLDTQVKPVLFFSPTCGPCKETVAQLIGIDPEGNAWAPVQAGGDQEDGREYLRQSGYRGNLYQRGWSGPVPALFLSREGKTMEIRGTGEILEAVRGAGH